MRRRCLAWRLPCNIPLSRCRSGVGPYIRSTERSTSTMIPSDAACVYRPTRRKNCAISTPRRCWSDCIDGSWRWSKVEWVRQGCPKAFWAKGSGTPWSDGRLWCGIREMVATRSIRTWWRTPFVQPASAKVTDCAYAPRMPDGATQ